MDSDEEGAAAVGSHAIADTAGGRPRVRLAFKPGAKVGVAPTDPGADAARCHVCGERGHCAGFKGPLYVDCSSETMACYLCKLKGHSTQTCPHRIVPTAATGGGGVPRSGVAAALPRGWRRRGTLPLAREVTGGLAAPPYECRLAAAAAAPSAYDGAHRWRVDTAVLRMHSRRLSLLSFHPHFPDRLVGADKSGELSVWNFVSKSDRSVWAGAHRWLINGLCWAGARQPHVAVTASADGTVRLLDVASRASELLLDLNPSGWTGVESQWRMLYALSTPAVGVGGGGGDGPPVIAGDDVGRFWGLDPRDRHKVVGHVQAHKRGCKVQSLHHNPAQPSLLVSAGNDWMVKLWDVRALSWRRDASLYTVAPTPNNTDRTPLTTYDEGTPAGAAALPASAAAAEGGDGDDDGAAAEGEDDGGDNDGGNGAAAAAASSSAAAAPAKPDRRAPAYSASKEPLAEPLGVLPHQRVVTAAYFSPVTGSKLLTTCIDNRLRVWDDLHAIAGCGLGGGAGSGSGRKAAASAPAPRAPPPPSAEIVHSHDFARYLTPFKAVWDPKDARERTVVCGRYISEPFYFPRDERGGGGGDGSDEDGAAADGGGGSDPYLALHPIDVLDVGPPASRAGSGGGAAASSAEGGGPSTLQQLVDPLLPTICPVVAVHPRARVIACGSSRSVYLWRPVSVPVGGWRQRPGRRQADGSSSDDHDSDDDGGGGGRAAGVKRRRGGMAAASLLGATSAYFGGGGRGTGDDDATAASPLPPPAKGKPGGRRGGKGGGAAAASVLSPADIAALAQRRLVTLVQGPRDGAAGAGGRDDDEDDADAGEFGPLAGGKGKGGEVKGKK